jgi:hypothetical protein
MSKLDELPHDYTVLAIPAHASIACARLGDKRRAKRLHAMLEPHRHRLVTTVASWWGRQRTISLSSPQPWTAPTKPMRASPPPNAPIHRLAPTHGSCACEATGMQCSPREICGPPDDGVTSTPHRARWRARDDRSHDRAAAVRADVGEFGPRTRCTVRSRSSCSRGRCLKRRLVCVRRAPEDSNL